MIRYSLSRSPSYQDIRIPKFEGMILHQELQSVLHTRRWHSNLQ